MTLRPFALFVALSVVASAAALATSPAGGPRVGDPYTLDTCAVSGSRLGSMGDPVVRIYNGREVRFCCEGCIPEFEKDVAAGFAKVDEKIIAQQEPFYPLTHCVVKPEDPLDIEGAHDISARYVWNNRFVRFCCEGCVAKFEAEPEKYIAALDSAVITAQKDSYPLTTCVISGEKLGDMGKTIDKVYGNRLVRFCCEPCVAEFEKDPAKYFRQIDAAKAR